MTRGMNLLLPGVGLLFALISLLPSTSCDRSPYVPDPVTYPGLLPQFTSTTAAPPGGGGQHQVRPSTAKPSATPRPPASEHRPTTTEHATTTVVEGEPEGEDNGLGERFGEERPDNRPDWSGRPDNRPQRPDNRPQRPQRPCDPQRNRVPCYDCIVYISRTGEITRFYPSRENRDD